MFTKFILDKITQKAQSRNKLYSRVRAGVSVGIVGLFSNVLLFAIKIFVGLISGSVAIIADAVNSLFDFVSSVMTVVGFYVSGKQPDKGHPYGHQRFEDIAGFITAMIMLYVGLQFIYSSILKILHPVAVELNYWSVGLLLLSIVIKLWQRLIYSKVGQSVGSKTIMTAASDARNDALTTFGILIAIVISVTTNLNLDGYIGVVVALFIVISSVLLIKNFTDSLMGQRPNDALIEEITQQLDEYDHILGFHDLMIHQYGPDMVYAIVHIELDSSFSLDYAHEIVDHIERDFQRKYAISMVVHVDPIDIHSKKFSRFFVISQETINGYHAGLKIHDFHVERLKNGDFLLQFDIVVPENSRFSDEEWLVEINQDLRKKLGDVTVQINFDHTDLGADKSII